MQDLERFLEAAPDAMLFVRVDGQIVHANSEVERVFGYTQEELRGQPIEVLIPEALRERHVCHRARFAEAPSRRPMGSGLELRGRRKDGREVPVEVSLSPVETSEGAGVLAAIRDISERRRAEAAVSRAEALLREAVEVQEVAFAVFDAEGGLLADNRAFRDLLTMEDGAPEASRGGLLSTLTGGVEGDAVEASSRVQWCGRALQVSRRWMMEGELALTVVDHTDEDAREEELRHALEAKNDFLSRMSHELRTPLNAVLGFASLLQRDRQAPLNERQREMVSHIRAGGQHLLRLVDEVLDLARIDLGRIDVLAEPVDLADRVDDVVATLEPIAASRGVSLVVVSATSSAPLALGDPMRVTQILLNLLSNAIKYGREGGRVTVGAEVIEGARVRLRVEDDGPGIPIDKQALLFQPFQRAGQERGAVEGAGIGLALSRRLASLMHGKVDFESTPGSGSTFWLDLPAQA